jgi:hypothetical protein
VSIVIFAARHSPMEIVYLHMATKGAEVIAVRASD